MTAAPPTPAGDPPDRLTTSPELWQVILMTMAEGREVGPITDRAVASILASVVTGIHQAAESVDSELGIWLVQLSPEQADMLRTNGLLSIDWPHADLRACAPADWEYYRLEAEL